MTLRLVVMRVRVRIQRELPGMGSCSSGGTVTARRAGGIFGIRRVLRCPCPSFPRFEIISGLGGSVGILSGLVNRAGASEAILEFVLKLVEGQALRSSVLARRNSPSPLPRVRASSGIRLGPRTKSAITRITTNSIGPIPNMRSI